MFGNDDRWRLLSDPLDSPAGQVDLVSVDGSRGGLRLAAGRAGTDGGRAGPGWRSFRALPRARRPSRRWQPASPTPPPRSAQTLYGSMPAPDRPAVGGSVRAVLFWQGENDARRLTPPGGTPRRPCCVSPPTSLRRLPRLSWSRCRSAISTPTGLDADADRHPSRAGARLGRASHPPGPGPVRHRPRRVGVHFVHADDVEIAARPLGGGDPSRRRCAATPGARRASSGRCDDGDGGELVLTADIGIADDVGVEGFVVRSGGREVPLLSRRRRGTTADPAGAHAGGARRRSAHGLSGAAAGPRPALRCPRTPLTWRLPYGRAR